MVRIEQGAYPRAVFMLLATVFALHTSLVVAAQGTPNVPCRAKAPASWTEQERWTWEQLCQGRPANLAQKYGGEVLPHVDANWPKKRSLSARFLATILAGTYRDLIPQYAVRISGARFSGMLELGGARVDGDVALLDCVFEGDVQMAGLLAARGLSLNGSIVGGSIDLSGIRVEQSLDLSGGKFQSVNLGAARIGGQLILEKTVVDGDLNLNGIHVGNGAFLRGAQAVDVNLKAARIENSLEMDELRVANSLDMDSIRVTGHVLMRAKGEYKDVRLSFARIEGILAIEDVSVSGALNMDGINVQRSVFLRALDPGPRDADLIFAVIGGNLDFSGSVLGRLDLTGARIAQTLRFGLIEGKPVQWRSDAMLILRNAATNALEDYVVACARSGTGCPNSWPSQTVLGGFTYLQLGALDPSNKSTMATRSADWWTGWIGLDRTFSPQPYQYAATVLRGIGYSDKADDVLYAGKKRETAETFKMMLSALRNHEFADATDHLVTDMLLLLQWAFTGFGYGSRLLSHSLFWVLLFVGFGVYELRRSGEGHRNGLPPYPIAYSFDMLLPIIKLREKHYEIDLQGRARKYFYVHKIMGYVFASFIIAALAGITK